MAGLGWAGLSWAGGTAGRCWDPAQVSRVRTGKHGRAGVQGREWGWGKVPMPPCMWAPCMLAEPWGFCLSEREVHLKEEA